MTLIPQIETGDYNLSLLPTVEGHYENGKYVFFWNGPFSNWYPAKFTMYTGKEWGEMTFTCSEQAMMFYKALVFKDKESLIKIMSTNLPREQKALGRKVKGFDQAVWEATCVDFVTESLVAKFTADHYLLEVLMETGDKIIVEASPYDKVWGIGMGVDHPNILDESKWDGKNLLGVCLMNARAIIRELEDGIEE